MYELELGPRTAKASFRACLVALMTFFCSKFPVWISCAFLLHLSRHIGDPGVWKLDDPQISHRNVVIVWGITMTEVDEGL